MAYAEIDSQTVPCPMAWSPRNGRGAHLLQRGQRARPGPKTSDLTTQVLIDIYAGKME